MNHQSPDVVRNAPPRVVSFTCSAARSPRERATRQRGAVGAGAAICLIFASVLATSSLLRASEGIIVPTTASPDAPAQPAAAIARAASMVVPATLVQSESAWAGFAAAPLPRVLAERLGLSPDVGVVVMALHPEGPATRAGLRQRDVLIASDGEPIDSPAEWAAHVAGLAAGTELELTILRDGDRTTIRLTLEPGPPQER